MIDIHRALATVIAAVAFASPASAQPASSPAAPDASASAAPSSGAYELAEGEVRKIDKERKKLTLRHGPLKNLDMPGMTMAFQVKEETILDRVQVGDKVRFLVEKLDGKLTVTKLEGPR